MPKIEMGKQYRTRDGRPVRILCVDCQGEFPVIFSVRYKDYDGFEVRLCGHDGVAEYNNAYDLIEVRPRIKLSYWVNIYTSGEKGYTTGENNDTKAEALLSARACSTHVATVKIEIDCEEGEGLNT